MKKMMIGVVAVLALTSASFADTLAITFQDITVQPGETGYMRMTIVGTDLSNGFSLFVENLQGWLVGANEVPDWPGVIYPLTKDEDVMGDGTVWWIAPDSIGVEQIPWNGFWVDYVISVPATAAPGVYKVTSTISQWDNFMPTYATYGGGAVEFIPGEGNIYVVPEPVSALLLGLGGLFLRRRR